MAVIPEDLHYFEIPRRFGGQGTIARGTGYLLSYGVRTNTGKRIAEGAFPFGTVTKEVATEVYTKSLTALGDMDCGARIVMDYAMIIPPDIRKIGQKGWDSRAWERELLEVADKPRMRLCSGTLRTPQSERLGPWTAWEGGLDIKNYSVDFPAKGGWAKVDVYISYFDKK